ncbi:TPA: hypothetical protein DCS99_00025 [Candidatus Wolfebacteria bacterium]|nr:hypothetical protein [Candidatus Wolfebacteria bacterium]
MRLLQSRNKPNALAARAIIRSGTGHKYWSRFQEAAQVEIEKEAKEINELLFTPTLRTPIKTLDLPVAGRGYSSQALPLVFELVNIANNVSSQEIFDDKDGQSTIQYLKTCHRILNRVSGTHASSLGLHPIVYFYSSNGRYQATSFFGVIELIKEFEKANQWSQFVSIRRQFDEFLLKYKMFPIQVVWKYGSGVKGYLQMKELYLFIFEALLAKKSESMIIAGLASDARFTFLQPHDKTEGNDVSASFNKETKSAAFLRDALKEPLRCKICGGLIHYNSISIDHIKRKADGGLGTVDNAQLAHPYCNTTIKN